MHRSFGVIAITLILATGCLAPQGPEATSVGAPRTVGLQLGDTPEIVVRMLGEPTERSEDASGNTIWTYRNFHRDRRDRIVGGFRRRVVFDPVLRSDTVIVEPIDDRLAAKLAPQSWRLTFRDGHLIRLETVPET